MSALQNVLRKIRPVVRPEDGRQPWGETLPDGRSSVNGRATQISQPWAAPPDVLKPPIPPAPNQVQVEPDLNRNPLGDAPDNSTLLRLSPELLQRMRPDSSQDTPQMPTPQIKPMTLGRNPFEETMADKYMASATPYEDPKPVLNTSAFRDRLAKPVDPYQRAQENYNASMTAPPDYGQDSQGNQRTHGKEGIGGRILSFLKGAANDYTHGGNALTALMSGTESAVDTNRNAKLRLQERQAKNAGEYGQQVKLKGEQARIQNEQLEAATRADALRRDPQDRQNKLDEAERDNIRGIYTNLDDFDPVKNPEHQQLAARAQALGMILPAKAKGEAHKPIEVLGPDGMTYTRQIWSPEKNDYVPQLINGQPVVTRKVSPLDPKGVSANTKYAADVAGGRQDKGFGQQIYMDDRRAERERQRQEQSDDRAASRREMADRRSATQLLNSAENYERQAEQEAAKGQGQSEDTQAYYNERAQALREQAQGVRDNAIATYGGDGGVIEVVPPSAADVAKNPFAKPKYRMRARGATTQSTPQSGKYAGQTFPSPASLKQAFPGKSEAEIRQIVTSNGGAFSQ